MIEKQKHLPGAARAVVIMAGILYMSGCIDDGPWKNCPEIRFSEEYKRYTVFNPGSYWIYQDSSGTLTDSLVLLNQSLLFFAECDYHGYPTEYLEQEFYSSIAGSAEVSGDPDWPDYYMSDANGVTLGFFITDISVGSDGGSLQRMKYEEFLDSVNISGVWYKDVKVISAPTDPKMKFFWAKDVGMVRRAIRVPGSESPHDFRLIRYRLN